jgi:F-type H+-transporting ATPase subunit delta
MLAQQVAKKYATALFELARERNIIDLAWDQLNSLADYLKKDRTFIDFLTAPQVNDEQKSNLIERAFADRIEKTFYNFLLHLAEKRRIKFLPEIVEEFDRLVREHKGIARVEVTTAIPITGGEREKLIAELAEKTSLKIELEEKIDKAIIGGMIVKVREQIIDGSLKRGLNLLRNRLMKVKVH